MKLQRKWMLLILLMLFSASPASAREWTSKAGKLLFEAELVDVKNGKLRLKRKDGEIVSVSLYGLSKADRSFLTTIGKAKLKIEPSKQTPDEVIAAIMLMGGQVEVIGNNVPITVVLYSTKITDAELEHLKRLTTLRMLLNDGDNITDAGLVHLKGLTKMRSLGFANANITGRGLEHLKGMTELQDLNLAYTKITDAALKHLKDLPKLQTLSVDHTKITDAGLEHLKGLTGLRWIGLSYTKVTDAGLEHLKGLTKLKHLSVDGTYVTVEGVRKLQKALPKCRIKGLLDGRSARMWKDDSGRHSVEAELVDVKNGNVRLKRPKNRSVVRDNPFGSDTFRPSPFRRGKTITVPLSKLSAKDLEYLASPAAIEKVATTAIRNIGAKVGYHNIRGRDPFGKEAATVAADFSHTKVTDAGLEHLKALTNLRFLNLEHTRITHVGLEHLKGLKKLECLYVGDTVVGDVGLKHLKRLTNLETLRLSDTKVTDAGLEHLNGLTKLQELRLMYTNVTDEGVKILQQALPKCRVYYSKPRKVIEIP